MARSGGIPSRAPLPVTPRFLAPWPLSSLFFSLGLASAHEAGFFKINKLYAPGWRGQLLGSRDRTTTPYRFAIDCAGSPHRLRVDTHRTR
jgi:hypothetical protein